MDEGISAAPGLSPGVVRDDEYLLREMFDPEHVKDGEILERAIPVSDLRQSGFSLHRMAYVSRQFVEDAVRKRLTVPRKTLWHNAGVAVLHSNEIRCKRLDADQARAFVIIDTATVKNRGHASLFAAEPDRGPAHARKLRALLLPLLHRRTSIKEAYESFAGRP
ncbi:MAG: hypothetical protein OXP28_16660 [Gammaproteobacteria bacterium]|nr:hypothetical protein [Gammaproteobacteria bacterium]